MNPTRQKIVFFGSAKFALPTLRTIHQQNNLELVLVVTKPDKPSGRGLKEQPTPVKLLAQELGLKVTETIPPVSELAALGIEKIVVVAYGLFVPAEIINRYPCINLHPSLLPKYRGPSPLQSALLNGDALTGITTMLIDEGMDSGDILLQEEIPLDINQDFGGLHDLCAQKGAELIIKTLNSDLNKIRRKQNSSAATICKKIEKSDSQITPGEMPLAIHNRVRAIGGYLENSKGQRIKILQTTWQDGKLVLEKVQPEGKPAMAYREYLKGYGELKL